MSQPQNLPELLQARMKLALFNWGKRTFIWSLALGLLSAMAPSLRFLLILWLVFSAFSLAAILIGLKIAKNLKFGSTSAFPSPGPNEPRDVGGHRPPPHEAEDDPSPQPAHGPSKRSAASDEIIEIEAEVLPPDRP